MSNQTPSPDARAYARAQEIHSGAQLAPDEVVEWQGGPRVLAVARKVMCGDLVAGYFGLLIAVDLARAAFGRIPLSAALWPLLPAAVAAVIIFGLARTVARSTRYLVTSRRIILRYGAALPRNLSIPFGTVRALSVAVGSGGRGDIALAIRGPLGVPYLKLWPHVRPWQLRAPVPTLRDVDGAAVLATRLSRTLSQAEAVRKAAAPASPALKSAA